MAAAKKAAKAVTTTSGTGMNGMPKMPQPKPMAEMPAKMAGGKKSGKSR